MIGEARSCSTTLGRRISRRVSHMVRDDIHNDGHAGSPAPRNHVGKLRLIAGARGKLVGDGLVAGPPVGSIFVLLGWGHLSGTAHAPCGQKRVVGVDN